MSNGLDPDQARHFVGPGLGPNCLQRLMADDKIHRLKVLNRFDTLKIIFWGKYFFQYSHRKQQ